MLTLMLISANVREKRILQMAFEQHQIKVIEALPDRASYIKALQYNPDFVVIEFPPYYTEQINFSKNIFAAISKKKKLLMLGYGQEMAAGEERALKASGIKYYLLRPLKFSAMMKYLEEHLGVFAPEQIVWKNKTHTDDDDVFLGKILNIDILPTVKLEMLSERIKALLAFPFTVLRVLQLTEDLRSGAPELGKVINADPVISANILKMANTVFFASRSRRITTIQDAIVRIGFSETKHLTMTMSVMNSLNVKTENIGFDRLQFWHHCMAVAVISEHISKKVSGLNSSEMFLSGLLHSFGIILFDEFFAALFEKLLIRTTDKGISFTEAEQEIMVITHLDLTFRLFEAWKIPNEIIETIRYSEKVEDTIVKDPKNILQHELKGVILHVADTIAKSLSLGNECDMVVGHVDSDVFNLISMNTGVTTNFVESVTREIDIFRKFLRLEDEVQQEADFKDKEVLLISPPLPFFVPVEHYLQRLGFTITRHNSANSLDDYNDRFAFAVFWYKSYPNEAEIQDISKMRTFGSQEPLKSIVFQEEVSETAVPNHYVFENRIDLRLVLVAIQEIMETPIGA